MLFEWNIYLQKHWSTNSRKLTKLYLAEKPGYGCLKPPLGLKKKGEYYCFLCVTDESMLYNYIIFFIYTLIFYHYRCNNNDGNKKIEDIQSDDCDASISGISDANTSDAKSE